MKVALCDDEAVIRQQLTELIRQQDEDCAIMEFASAEALLETAEYIDLLFLDIQLGEINGIEAAKRLREKQPDITIVFVTAIKDYIFDAFDVTAFQYLLKPLDEERFADVFCRARKVIAGRKNAEKQMIIFKTKQKTYTLKKRNIFYAENQLKKVIIHTTIENAEIYATMREIEEQLDDSFYRCHRGYLVNMEHIAGYSGDSIQIDNGDSIFLAREKYNDFVKTYMAYLKRRMAHAG